MEATSTKSKRVVLGMVAVVVVMGLLLLQVEASCTVKNKSGNDILFVPVSAPSVKIKVKIGSVVLIPSTDLTVIIKNLGTGNTSAPLQLVDGTVLVCVTGALNKTVSIYPGDILNGIISLILGASPVLSDL